MPMKNEQLVDLFAVHAAGGWQTAEPSRALPRHMYGDPSNVVEFPAEIERQRKAKEVRKPKKKSKQSKFRYKEPK